MTAKANGCRDMRSAPIAIVLAGGQSTRMGTDKALLPYRGMRLIDHMVQVASDVLRAHFSGEPKIIVSGGLFNVSGIPCVLDEIPGMGPLGGVVSVIRNIDPPSSLLVLPVDMPFLTAEVLGLLLECEMNQVDVIQFRDQVLPLLLKFNNQTQRILEDPDVRSFRRLLSCLRVHPISLNPELEWRFFNANTPAQWEEALRA